MTYQKLLSFVVLLGVSWGIYAQNDNITTKRLELTGFAQMGYSATFTPKQATNNSFYLGKTELMLQGKITSKWDMGAIVQLNSPVMLKELFTRYEFMPELKLRIGQIKTPFGLENQIAPCLNDLIIGGSKPTLFFAGIAGDPRYMGTTGRDIGLELSGDLWNKKLSYNVAIMNGNGINRLSGINPKMYGAALHIRPLNNLQVTSSYLGGKMVSMNDHTLYFRQRASIGAQWKSKMVSLLTEYMYGKCDYTKENTISRNNPTAVEPSQKITEHSHGAYVTATFHLPKRFDLVLSCDYLNRNTSLNNALYTTTIGVQQWFWGLCRWQLEYQYHHLNGNMPFLYIKAPGHKLAAQIQFAF